MKIKNIILLFIVCSIFGGCYFKTATYKSFKNKRNTFLYSNIIPKQHKERREVYDENKYIYKFNGDDSRCVYAYLTNRDENPERVIEWFIISGEEYCKEAPGVGTWM